MVVFAMLLMGGTTLVVLLLLVVVIVLVLVVVVVVGTEVEEAAVLVGIFEVIDSPNEGDILNWNIGDAELCKMSFSPLSNKFSGLEFVKAIFS